MEADPKYASRGNDTQARVHTNQNVAECAGLIAIFLPSLHGVIAN